MALAPAPAPGLAGTVVAEAGTALALVPAPGRAGMALDPVPDLARTVEAEAGTALAPALAGMAPVPDLPLG